HPVERVIDLDTVQPARVKPEELLFGNIGRIENRLPFFVAETRRAEPNPRHSGIISEQSFGTLVIIEAHRRAVTNLSKIGRFWRFFRGVFNMRQAYRNLCNLL